MDGSFTRKSCLKNKQRGYVKPALWLKVAWSNLKEGKWLTCNVDGKFWMTYFQAIITLLGKVHTNLKESQRKCSKTFTWSRIRCTSSCTKLNSRQFFSNITYADIYKDAQNQCITCVTNSEVDTYAKNRSASLVNTKIWATFTIF